MFDKRYDADPIAQMREARKPRSRQRVELVTGLFLEHSGTEFCGEVLDFRDGALRLRDFAGQVRVFPLNDAYLIDGEPVQLVPRQVSRGRQRTASGSFAAPAAAAKVAVPSRIFVEGTHDAELVERVWGADLRDLGVVVIPLAGADHLATQLQQFQPTAARRAGVLLDHLVTGSKESRIAQSIAAAPFAAHVLVLGHPFIDIWQAVKPQRVGLRQWPDIPRGQDWKTGICQAVGWPADEAADIAAAWSRILQSVRHFRDLEPALVGKVEELIDFVTAADSAPHRG